MRLDVRLLGPVEVAVDGHAIQLTGRLRTMLLVLAMSGGVTVSLDRMVAAMWGQNLPDNPRGSVQTYVTRLRRVLGASMIGTHPAGYVLNAGPDEVDGLRFLCLLDRASSSDDPATERGLLGRALTLWRGMPFEGVRSAWLEEVEAPRLLERYLAGVERSVDLDLGGGRLDGLAARLRELTSRHPLREPLWARLLMVLDQSGRQAEALETYETVRRRIAEELGADPGPELRSLHARLLAGGTPARQRSAVARPVVPRQLPADVPGFTGRGQAMSTMDKLIGDGLSPLVITAIGGAAGIGKTTLAVHWAHHAADRFPDGQLYANLRGFDPSGSPKAPSEVVRGFLDALQVPPQQVPADVDAQVSLYRSLLAGKRMLVVLDNARDSDQVRPLLPGAPGCLVVVTSRDGLLSLIAAEGAHPVTLDLLSAQEARHLLEQRIGPDRVAAEPDAVDAIINACARLPLALAIVAARAAARPDFRLDALAAELTRGLDAFDTASDTTDIRMVFSWSYRTLSRPSARLFRLLGLHPGPDLTAPAAAGLARVTLSHARSLLNELAAAHLIAEHLPGRFTLHDLLRSYAAELVGEHEGEADRDAALQRLVDHYLRTAYAAALLVNPYRDRIELTSVQMETAGEDLDDLHHAMQWFTSEYVVLLAAIKKAASLGWDARAWELAWTLTTFFGRRGLWHDWAAAQQVALNAAQRLSDKTKTALAHADLGRAQARLGRHVDGEAHMRTAIGIYRKLGDRAGEAHVQINLCNLFERIGRYSEALLHARQGLELFLSTGNHTAIARAHNNVGWCHALLGQYEDALVACRKALVLHERFGDTSGASATWDSLGYAYHHLADFEQAITCYRQAYALACAVGDKYNQADSLMHLGAALYEAGDTVQAVAVWQRSLSVFEEFNHPKAVQVRARLAALKAI